MRPYRDITSLMSGYLPLSGGTVRGDLRVLPRLCLHKGDVGLTYQSNTVGGSGMDIIGVERLPSYEIDTILSAMCSPDNTYQIGIGGTWDNPAVIINPNTKGMTIKGNLIVNGTINGKTI